MQRVWLLRLAEMTAGEMSCRPSGSRPLSAMQPSSLPRSVAVEVMPPQGAPRVRQYKLFQCQSVWGDWPGGNSQGRL